MKHFSKPQMKLPREVYYPWLPLSKMTQKVKILRVSRRPRYQGKLLALPRIFMGNSEKVKARVYWQLLLMKMTATATHGCTCLGHLGGGGDRDDDFYFLSHCPRWPRQLQSHVTGVIVLNFTNGKTA
jgi:hypothetical protein